METVQSLRWKDVVRQQYDYSCGTGSISNLLKFLGKPFESEKGIIAAYAKLYGDEKVEQAQKEGFSLLDLKRMLAVLGYKSEGVRYEKGTLPDEFHPMIVYLVVREYRHFSVFAGIEANQVVLLDSARGKIRVTIERFLHEWDGTALLPDPTLTATVSLPDERMNRTVAQDAIRRCAVGK